MKHQTISFLKSGIRIAGYACLGLDVAVAAGILIVSEILGIIEEVGHE